MPTKRMKETKKKTATRKNSKSQSNSIITKTSDSIFSKLKRSKTICLNGCKGFGAHFYIEYLTKLKKLTRSEYDNYVKELIHIEINMTSKISSNHMFKLNKHELPVFFLSNMSQVIFDEITKGNILYCSIHKKIDGMVMPIHTFILSNGSIIYNSWTTDTTISCNDFETYDSEYAYYEDEDECARKVAVMSPKRILVHDSFNKLKQLTTTQNNFGLITSLFGLDESNIIGLGKKAEENMDMHQKIITTDSNKIMSDFHNSDILFVKI